MNLKFPAERLQDVSIPQVKKFLINLNWNVIGRYLSVLHATSRKVAVSIPDGVFRIFHWHNPSGSTVVLMSA
jgi:hypothetical protein